MFRLHLLPLYERQWSRDSHCFCFCLCRSIRTMYRPVDDSRSLMSPVERCLSPNGLFHTQRPSQMYPSRLKGHKLVTGRSHRFWRQIGRVKSHISLLGCLRSSRLELKPRQRGHGNQLASRSARWRSDRFRSQICFQCGKSQVWAPPSTRHLYLFEVSARKLSHHACSRPPACYPSGRLQH